MDSGNRRTDAIGANRQAIGQLPDALSSNIAYREPGRFNQTMPHDDAPLFDALQEEPLAKIRQITRRMIKEADEEIPYSAAWVAATNLYSAELIAAEVGRLSGRPTLDYGV